MSDERLDECVIWPKKISRGGYGIACRDGKQLLAHRVLWIESGRELPQDWVLHHLCFEKRCVNLDHLVAVTVAQHQELHRESACKKCGQSDFRITPLGQRKCRVCANAARRKRYAEDETYRTKQRKLALERAKKRKERSDARQTSL